MTFNTCHILMLSVKFEFCLIVVEPGSPPVVKCMAPGTINLSVLRKLSVVNIRMALRTCLIQGVESLVLIILPTLKMTIPAGLPGMHSLQCITSFIVVEVNGCPPFGNMTFTAIPARIIVITDQSLMDIRMTIYTFSAYVPEFPLS
jgi:hypothetical protein